MNDDLRTKAAHLAELCHGQGVEACTDYILGFLRVLRADDARRIKLLKEAVDELVATHELREHKGETITPLQRRAVEQGKKLCA